MGRLLLRKPAPQMILDDAVDLQIGISPDWGSKVAVIITCKSEMSHALRAVTSLLHTAEHQPAHKRFHGGAGDLLKQLLKLLRMDLLIGYLPAPSPHRFHIVAQIVDKHVEPADFFRIRSLMDTVYERCLQPVEMLGNRLVCGEHEILDQTGRGIPLIGHNINRVSLSVKINLALLKIKINSAPLFSSAPQERRQLCHGFKHRHKLRIALTLRLVPVLQNPFDGGVGHAAVHPDHGLCDLIVFNPPLTVNFHQAAQRQPVNPLIQRTDAV